MRKTKTVQRVVCWSIMAMTVVPVVIFGVQAFAQDGVPEIGDLVWYCHNCKGWHDDGAVCPSAQPTGNITLPPPQQIPDPPAKPKIDHKQRRIERSITERLQGKRQDALDSLSRDLARMPEEIIVRDTWFQLARGDVNRAMFGIGRTREYRFRKMTGHTSGTEVSTESLQRALLMLDTVSAGIAKKNVSDEDIRFLADQAGRAMFGADLEVVIPDVPTPSADFQTAARQIQSVQHTVDRLRLAQQQQYKLEQEIAVQEARARRDGSGPDGMKEVLARYRDQMNKVRDIQKELEKNQTALTRTMGVEIAE